MENIYTLSNQLCVYFSWYKLHLVVLHGLVFSVCTHGKPNRIVLFLAHIKMLKSHWSGASFFLCFCGLCESKKKNKMKNKVKKVSNHSWNIITLFVILMCTDFSFFFFVRCVSTNVIYYGCTYRKCVLYFQYDGVE